MAKERELTVDELVSLIDYFKKRGEITGKAKIMLASDEEGNSFSPLMQFKTGMYNVSAEKDRFILYPSSMHLIHDEF